jgi:Transcriptional regulator
MFADVGECGIMDYKSGLQRERYMQETGKKYYEIGSISKACWLIELLSTQKSWELAALSKALRLPKSTVHRMLLTLEDNGYVVQEKQRGEYCLSFKMFSLGSRMLQHASIVDITRPYCMELREKVNETINLCVQFDAEMLVVDRHVTTQALRQDTVIGGTFSMLQSASGKIYLAFAHEAEVGKSIALMRERVGNDVVDKLLLALREELKEVQRTGLAYDAEEEFIGVRCVAVPLMDFQNSLVATLSVSIPTVRINKQSLANIKRHLIHISKKISTRLGASPGSLPF